MARRGLYVALAAAFLVFAALYLNAIRPNWKITPDSMTYVEGAKSLAAGQGYREFGNPAPLFPPGTSALLAAGWLFGHPGYRLMNAEVMLAALAAAALCFFLFRKTLGNTGSATVALLCLGSTAIFSASTYLLSDIFYLLLSLGVFWCYQRGHSPATILCTAAALMVRSAGLCLAAALFLDALRRRPFRWTAVLAHSLPIGLALLWEWRNRHLGMSYSAGYLQAEPWVPASGHAGPAALWARFQESLGYGRVLEDLLTNGWTAELTWAILPGLILIALLIAGIVRLSRGPTPWPTLPVTCLYLAFYAIAIGAAPPPEVRYLLPLLPLFFAFLTSGFQQVVAATGARWLFAPAALLVTLYLVAGFQQDLDLAAFDRKNPFPGQSIRFSGNEDFQRIALWWQSNTPQTESYACQHPGIVRLLTGREGVHYPLSQPPEKVRLAMQVAHTRYLLLNLKSGDDRKLSSLLQDHPGFHLLRSERKAQLYELVD